MISSFTSFINIIPNHNVKRNMDGAWRLCKTNAGCRLFLVVMLLLGQCVLPWTLPMRSTGHHNRRYRTSYCTMIHKDAATLAEFTRKGKALTDVRIESPLLNSRKITASIVVDSSMNHVWSILTDYNNLAKHVPNLVESKLVPTPTGGTRLFQEGAQKIIGFDFRASLFMDMKEMQPTHEIHAINGQDWRIAFACVQSSMFAAFDGEWILRPHSVSTTMDPSTKQSIPLHRTQLTYNVLVRPKGPVPVMALEWRIKEDIPANMFAIKFASEALQTRLHKEGHSNKKHKHASSNVKEQATSWSEDETLGQYMHL